MADPAALQSLIIGLVSYVAGFASGLVLSEYRKDKFGGDNSKLVLMVVTLVWALSMFVDIISSQYETSPLVHGLMGAIVGYYYKPLLEKKK